LLLRFTSLSFGKLPLTSLPANNNDEADSNGGGGGRRRRKNFNTSIIFKTNTKI